MKSSWKDITIGEYDQVRDVLVSKDDDQTKDLKILSILSGESIDVIRDKSFDDVSKMIVDASFLREPAVVGDVESFSYDGYVFSKPRLDLTYGQLIDVEHSKGYVGLLGCILIPDGHKYNDGYQIDFGGIPFMIAKAVIESFLYGLMDSMQHTVKSIRRKLRVRRLMRRDSTHLYNLLSSILPLLSYRRLRI